MLTQTDAETNVGMNNEKYIPVATEDLKVDTILDFNIYIKPRDRVIFFREKNHPFTRATLNKLVANKLHTIFILKDDREKYERYYNSIHNNGDPATTKDDNPSVPKEGFVLSTLDTRYALNRDGTGYVEQYYKTYFNYYPIEKDTLVPGLNVKFNIYKKKDIDVELYFGPKRQNDKSDVIPEDVKESQLPLVISRSEIYLYKLYLQNLTDEYLSSGNIPQELQYSIIRENSKLIVKDALEDPRNGENIRRTSAVVETLIDTILNNKHSFYNLLNISSYDYYTYAHSLNVCTISIGLGMEVNIPRSPDLFNLGLGALLHDIGKSTVDPCIINKLGRLSKEEFMAVKHHVIAGKRLLEKSNCMIPQGALIPLIQHHEKLTGTGYPHNLKGKKIHPFGRITGIVDFYDALATERPYRQAYTPFEALQLISQCRDDYDQKLIRIFINMLGHQKG